MFIVSLTYIVDLEKVDELLPLHADYLKNQYEKGNFIASGRKIPRTGGIILSKLDSIEKLEEVFSRLSFPCFETVKELMEVVTLVPHKAVLLYTFVCIP